MRSQKMTDLLLTAVAVDGVDHVGDLLLRHELVHDVEGHHGVLRQQLRESITRPGVVS